MLTHPSQQNEANQKRGTPNRWEYPYPSAMLSRTKQRRERKRSVTRRDVESHPSKNPQSNQESEIQTSSVQDRVASGREQSSPVCQLGKVITALDYQESVYSINNR